LRLRARGVIHQVMVSQYGYPEAVMHRLATAVVVSVAIAGCAADEPDQPASVVPAVQEQVGDSLSADDASAHAAVRETASPWSDIEAARVAGYTNQFPAGCIETEEGAQGFHFLNDALLDNSVNLHQPELLMYEPQSDGTLDLIGVDYAIPLDQWTDPDPPQLLNRPFTRNETLGVWAFHIWTHRENPSGPFAMFNPVVTCAAAEGVRL
jgi:hypothetical protein